MEARKTDEIICGSCGRPNLAEAEKCWYCQTPLVKEEQSESGDENPSAKKPEKEQPAQSSKSQEFEAEEDIPEWLKRVRELKARDYPVEEEEDQWQQQGLFGESEKKKESSPKASRKSQKKTDQPAEKGKKEKSKRSAPQPKLDINKQTDKEDSKKIEESKSGDENPSKDLPDGFVQFRPKNN